MFGMGQSLVVSSATTASRRAVAVLRGDSRIPLAVLRRGLEFLGDVVGEVCDGVQILLGQIDFGDQIALAVQIAQVPESMRGFGHIKEKNVKAAKEREASLLASYRSPATARAAAE